MAIEKFLAERALNVQESGIRRIFNLAASLKNPINFSIGQPDFDVPAPIKEAAIAAIQAGYNGYTVTQGLPQLREMIADQVARYYPEPPSVLVTSGVSGGLMLSLMATVNSGDEVLFPDPYFVSYPNLVSWFGGKPVPVSLYPDFRLDPKTLQAAITSKTKILILNSPNNPTGVVYDAESMKAICRLADERDLLIISDEIYRDLSFDGPACSPIEFAPHRTILLRGFGKSYGMTGWRMGYLVGPAPLVTQMSNMQQYTFVCAPQPAQHAGIVALDTDMTEYVNAYRRKRQIVEDELRGYFEFTRPSGGFYFFLRAPERHETGTAFVEAAIEKNVLCVPGNVFSRKDSHFRISYAVKDEVLHRGCQILRSLV